VLIPNPAGNYNFLRGIAPYSAGAVAHTGFEIVHARFAQPVKLDAGFDRVKQHLAAVNRPLAALCAMELRSPKPFTFEGFNAFNAGYIETLKSWNLFLDGVNPVARTNVAPEIAPPTEPSLYAFSYTAPSKSNANTFIVAGAGELPEGSLKPEDVVRRNDLSPDALREKVRFVLGLMAGRLHGLGADWPHLTATDVYTVHNFHNVIGPELLRPMGHAAAHGLTWHYSRPPIVTIEFEMDIRGCRTEITL
jgi:hypothetical protein